MGAARCLFRQTHLHRISDLPVLGRRLIELELRESLGSGEIEGRGLVEVKLGLGEGRARGRPGEADAADRDGGGCARRWRGA
jgi:hypothetical protein